MTDYIARNRALMRFLVLPTIFLTVVLLGGVRVSSDARDFVFLAPPLITLILAALLMVLFVRAGALDLRLWIRSDQPTLTNVSNSLLLLSVFFASAQAFNSVLPESGLFHWLFSFFFLWTLWNNQFAQFDARRLLRSLVVLFGTAFVLKHLLLAGFYGPSEGWLKKIAGVVLQGISLGTIDLPAYAPATGYISFFTLALYVVGLVLLTPAPDRSEPADGQKLLKAKPKLSSDEQLEALRELVRAL
ncbi:MAG: hypothetical protein QOD75_282 [Blastocatellia bacterium]|jgi:hypothetical protein|nr:hypothetical protein [Blastocatellia bacterium]